MVKEEFFVIEVKNVTKKYGKFVAVDDISFTINEGEIVGLLGPNGAGKSTTMNMITGFIEQTKGEIIVDGYDMLKKPKKAKREIGYMPEGVPLYTDLNVKEFVNYMAEIKQVDRKTRKEKVEKILEQTGLKDVEKKLIKNLSRGYKQRVSMAGALVGSPKILILDEPTVGLDPKQITEIRNLIKELGKTHTVILSSHILSEVSQICNKVIIINKGKIVAVDTPENLENKVASNNIVYVTVEDPENKIKEVTDKIKDIKKIELSQENEDGTKQYVIEANGDVDLRKVIFAEFAKESITIFEMKKADSTLEDAFMKLIEGGNK
jgi:ABC-2 type transport system ATP-binding protein